MMDLKRLLERRKELRPASGFAVVAVDTFGAPEDQGPYTAGIYADSGSARAAAQALKAESGGEEAVYVVGADGTWELVD